MILCSLFLISCSLRNVNSVVGMDGAAHDPFELFKGKPTAFIFVNHDCPICNAYSPEFNRIESIFGGGIRIQLVFSEPNFTPRAAKEYGKQFGLHGITLWVDADRRFAARCGATMVPEAIIYDAKGKKVWDGRIDDTFASLGVRREHTYSHDLRDALTLLSMGRRPKFPGPKPVGCIILRPDNS